jgi:hypothetical protein
MAGGFYVPGPDRAHIALNLLKPIRGERWRIPGAVFFKLQLSSRAGWFYKGAWSTLDMLIDKQVGMGGDRARAGMAR